MTDKTGTFTFHGVHFTGKRGDQVYADCILCGGDEKFYVNKTNGLWDCKKCGARGNLFTFLEKVHKLSLKEIKESDFSKLCINRKLPKAVFAPWQIGKHGDFYIIPVRNESNKIVDLRTYPLEGRMRGTAGCNVGLLGIHNLVETSPDVPVYVCEGEWDGMAMQWLLNYLKKPGVCVAVPGANTFKEEWAKMFQERVVYACYDHDEAGKTGELATKARLTGIAREIYYLHWDENLPAGYDMRDHIASKAIKLKAPRKSFEQIHGWMKNVPRKSTAIELASAQKEEPVQPISLEEVYKTFDKWLYLPDHNGIDVMLSIILSTKIPGDPLWMFLVAPPGGAKTELLNTTNTCPYVYMTSSLTSKTLISGTSMPGGAEASLLPYLDTKTLVIKDFTSILSQPDLSKGEIFGQLRDAYDGHSGKNYGSGQRKYFKSHFSILAGVTTSIYHLGDAYTSLGERFLKFMVGDNLDHKHERTMMRKAMKNVSQENVMREELAAVVKRFLAYKDSVMDKKLPFIPTYIEERVVALAQFCARVRGNIVRDRFYSEIILSKPSAEFGTRLCKQFVKQLMSLAIVRGKNTVGKAEYLLCKKTALDTVSQRNEDIVRHIYKETPTLDDSIRTAEIAHHTRYSVPTIQRLMADMHLLDVVRRTGKSNAYEWTLSEYMRNLIKEADLYRSETEIERVAIYGKTK